MPWRVRRWLRPTNLRPSSSDFAGTEPGEADQLRPGRRHHRPGVDRQRTRRRRRCRRALPPHAPRPTPSSPMRHRRARRPGGSDDDRSTPVGLEQHGAAARPPAHDVEPEPAQASTSRDRGVWRDPSTSAASVGRTTRHVRVVAALPPANGSSVVQLAHAAAALATDVNSRAPGTAATPRARPGRRASPTPSRVAPGTAAAAACPPRRACGRAWPCCTAARRRKVLPDVRPPRERGTTWSIESARARSTGSGTRRGRTPLGVTRRPTARRGTRTM